MSTQAFSGPFSSPIPPPPPLPIQRPPDKNMPFPSVCDANSELELLISREKCNYNDLQFGLIWKCFQSISPILQDGPTCGMAALAMALPDNSITLYNLKELTLNKGWSKHGEMFSCEWMANLARLAGIGRVLCIENGLNSHLNCIADCLSNGGFVLVPYDKTQNHSPGLLNGKSAHWAILTGMIVMKSIHEIPDSNLNLNPCNCCDSSSTEISQRFKVGDASSNFGVALTKNGDSICVKELTGVEDYAAIYVCAYQGHSRHVNLWSFSSLCASNNNLKELDPKREGCIIPPGGVEGGLCGKAVVLYPSN